MDICRRQSISSPKHATLPELPAQSTANAFRCVWVDSCSTDMVEHLIEFGAREKLRPLGNVEEQMVDGGVSIQAWFVSRITRGSIPCLSARTGT